MREIVGYFEDVVRILGIEIGATQFLREEIVSGGSYDGSLSCVIQYGDGSTLHVELTADYDDDPVIWTYYSFHYQSQQDELLFRYDAAPHHPKLPNFPHHLHLPSATIGVPQPRLREIAIRIWQYLHP